MRLKASVFHLPKYTSVWYSRTLGTVLLFVGFVFLWWNDFGFILIITGQFLKWSQYYVIARVGKILPVGWIWPTKGFCPACSSSFSPAWPRLEGQLGLWHMWPVPFLQMCSRAEAAVAKLRFLAAPVAADHSAPGRRFLPTCSSIPSESISLSLSIARDI